MSEQIEATSEVVESVTSSSEEENLNTNVGPLFSDEKNDEETEVEGEIKVEAEVKSEEEQVETKAEVKVEEKVEEEKTPDPKFAARFASLSRKEKALVEREKALKAQEQKFSKFSKIQELLEKGDVLTASEELGLDSEKYIEKIISKEKEEAEKETIDYKVAELEKKLLQTEEKLQKAETERKQREAEIQVNNFKSEISSVVSQNPDKFEICLTQGLEEVIFNTIQNHYNLTKEIISIEEAAEAVEAHYEEEFNSKWAKINKFKPKVTAPEEKVPAAEKKVVEEKKPIRTMSNKDASSSSTVNVDDMDDDELMALALKKYKGLA